MATNSSNPLLDDRTVDFLLYEVHDVLQLCSLEAFASHDREIFDLYMESVRRFARTKLWPTYKLMDDEPPTFEDGRIKVHPILQKLYPDFVELGVITADRSEAVGGRPRARR